MLRRSACGPLTLLILSTFLYGTGVQAGSSPWVVYKMFRSSRTNIYWKRMEIKNSGIHGSSLPHMLGGRAFIVAYVRKFEDPEASIVLYEFDESDPCLEPRKLRNFQLP